ncbi:MAG TPA: zinc-ribbon domain-containing protein [Spirillospora sp.]|nr:zinc-ribbon domain-containing protein [Spirillospora sp.]
MLFIVFGTKVKTEIVGEGEFFCPSCQTQRKYVRKRGKNYFSLYFIPLFPLGDVGEFIECQHCGRSYNPDVLKQKLSKPQPDVARLLNNVKSRLENGYPVEYMIRDLTDDGIDLEVARNIVHMAIGDKRKICPQCELTYASNVLGCTDCDRTLRSVQE